MTRRGPPLPPDRLLNLDGVGFCRVCAPAGDTCNVRTHQPCERPGKRPVSKPVPEELSRVREWIANGGNVAIVLTGNLVCVDQDAREVSGAVVSDLPSGFTVRTGSGGAHSYYRCADWERGIVDLRDDDGEHVGEIRSGKHSITVVPPSLHPSGHHYDVLRDLPVPEVERSKLESLAEQFDGLDADQEADRGGGRRDRRGGGRARLDDLDELIRHDGYRAEVREVLSDPSAPHNRRVWLAGFLHGAVGLDAEEITDLICRHARWTNLDRETTRKQVRSVIDSAGGGR